MSWLFVCNLRVTYASQVPLAKALAEALGCRTFFMEGYEADDVMATLAKYGQMLTKLCLVLPICLVTSAVLFAGVDLICMPSDYG